MYIYFEYEKSMQDKKEEKKNKNKSRHTKITFCLNKQLTEFKFIHQIMNQNENEMEIRIPINVKTSKCKRIKNKKFIFRRQCLNDFLFNA